MLRNGGQEGAIPFGESGVLIGIGTKGKTEPWSNPCASGEVACGWSSVDRNGKVKVENFVSRPPENPYSSTGNKPKSWMAVDFGPQRQIMVNHYAAGR